MIVFTRLLFWADGFTPFPWLILIHPRNRSHWSLDGLIAHERKHQEQMDRDGWFRFVFRYLLSKRWRLAYEVEAYKVSIEHNMSVGHAANLIATGYRLPHGVDEIKKLLNEEAE